VPRLTDEALDAALRAGRRMACKDEDLALVLAGLGERKLRLGLSALLGRRLVAGHALRRFVAAGGAHAAAEACAAARSRLAALLESSEGGANRFIGSGPVNHPAFRLLEADLRAVLDPGATVSRSTFDRLAEYFLTRGGQPRQRPAPSYKKADCPDAASWQRHSRVLAQLAPQVGDTLTVLERELNHAMARGVERLFRIARWHYRRALEAEASVDFTEGLARTLALLRQMDEFAQSRYRLEARYHHVLVDEFQDTSGAQWKLVSRLVESWGEGMGLAHDSPLQPSIFVVGDRKQSIYGFRDADVRMLRRARRYIGALRPDGRVRRSIARSFRSAPALLAFTNDLFGAMEKVEGRADSFRYGPADRFPVHLATSVPSSSDALGLLAAESSRDVAEGVAAEIDRLLATGEVRDRQTGMPRAARPGDFAILFRSRESHRDVELALEARGIPTYVYKGLGFFDADEVKDLVALLRFLADPASDLAAAAFLRSRFVRLSDVALRRLAPRFAAAVRGGDEAGETVAASLPAEDALVLRRLQGAVPDWLALVDRLPPAEVLDRVLDESAYAFELHGPRETRPART
jgi:ATP-dependent exoDNAse (exonuclease V) beta subunit